MTRARRPLAGPQTGKALTPRELARGGGTPLPLRTVAGAQQLRRPPALAPVSPRAHC